MPPQPPPRPPILRPPPLPPKGQPPLLPQRPVMTPTEELTHTGAGTGAGSGHQTPPLPLPIRKPKQTTSVMPPATKVQQQSAPIQAKLNQISLLQLSDMSLGELAATLQLPPARLACMTLTELALRLAELNKSNAEEEEEEVAVVEEEEETVEVKVDEEAEVCYKGGRKYEILSNTQEMEESVVHRQMNNTQRVDTQPTPTFISASEASERDRYAALREIMEQDLAVVSTQVKTSLQHELYHFLTLPFIY